MDRFLAEASEAGVDGLIVVDLPPEEDDELCEPATAAGLDFIRLVTPTSDAERLPVVLGSASGFVYYVAITGITGTRSAAADSISAAYKRISAATDLPVVTGFGIRTPEQAGEAASLSDGAIVGSAVVEIIAGNLGEDGKGTPEIVSKIAAFVGDLANGGWQVRLTARKCLSKPLALRRYFAVCLLDCRLKLAMLAMGKE